MRKHQVNPNWKHSTTFLAYKVQRCKNYESPEKTEELFHIEGDIFFFKCQPNARKYNSGLHSFAEKDIIGTITKT